MMMTINKNKALARIIVVLLVALTLLPQSSDARRQASRRASAARGTIAKPKLVLVIVVDQFRYDYLERFGDLFGSRGFRRLMNEGALFTNANYDYVPTVTACGHAAIFSGSVPALNGIVGNAWFDRESGKVRVMVADDSAHHVTGKATSARGGAASPRTLIGTTIGDQMRLANNFQSKVVTASLKDRSAVLPGGQRPNGAFWLSQADGEFVSSDYYFKELPAWVKKFDAGDRVDKSFGMKWERALPAEAYRRAQAENLSLQRSALGARFPYVSDAANKALGARFGEGKWVINSINDQLYLDQKLIAEKKVDPAEAERVAGEAALAADGMVNYFTRTQIVGGRMPGGPVARRVTNGFNRERSGDVWLI